MRVCVTGQTGFIGRHVCAWLNAHGHTITEDCYDAVIDLGWMGLPNYDSKETHIDQVPLRLGSLEDILCPNTTCIGTCLEITPNRTAYGMAKTMVRDGLYKMLPKFKWARLYYPYGPGQRSTCLWPRLRAALQGDDKEFHVIDGARDFLPIAAVASHICRIAMQMEVTGIIDVCSGVATPVNEFCERFNRGRVKIISDYPMPAYEPKSFHGNPEKLLHVA